MTQIFREGTKAIVLVADVALEDSEINESSSLHCRYVLGIVHRN